MLFFFLGGARDSVSPYAKCDIVLRRMPYILVLREKWLCCFALSYIKKSVGKLQKMKKFGVAFGVYIINM